MEHPFEDSAKLRILNANYSIPENDRIFIELYPLIGRYFVKVYVSETQFIHHATAVPSQVQSIILSRKTIEYTHFCRIKGCGVGRHPLPPPTSNFWSSWSNEKKINDSSTRTSRKLESSKNVLIWPTASKVTGGGGGGGHTTSFYSAKVCIWFGTAVAWQLNNVWIRPDIYFLTLLVFSALEIEENYRLYFDQLVAML